MATLNQMATTYLQDFQDVDLASVLAEVDFNPALNVLPIGSRYRDLTADEENRVWPIIEAECNRAMLIYFAGQYVQGYEQTKPGITAKAKTYARTAKDMDDVEAYCRSLTTA